MNMIDVSSLATLQSDLSLIRKRSEIIEYLIGQIREGCAANQNLAGDYSDLYQSLQLTKYQDGQPSDVTTQDRADNAKAPISTEAARERGRLESLQDMAYPDYEISGEVEATVPGSTVSIAWRPWTKNENLASFSKSETWPSGWKVDEYNIAGTDYTTIFAAEVSTSSSPYRGVITLPLESEQDKSTFAMFIYTPSATTNWDNPRTFVNNNADGLYIVKAERAEDNVIDLSVWWVSNGNDWTGKIKGQQVNLQERSHVPVTQIQNNFSERGLYNVTGLFSTTNFRNGFNTCTGMTFPSMDYNGNPRWREATTQISGSSTTITVPYSVDLKSMLISLLGDYEQAVEDYKDQLDQLLV